SWAEVGCLGAGDCWATSPVPAATRLRASTSAALSFRLVGNMTLSTPSASATAGAETASARPALNTGFLARACRTDLQSVRPAWTDYKSILRSDNSSLDPARAGSGSQLSAVGWIFTFCPADSGMTKSLVEVPGGTVYFSSTGLKICLPWPNSG